MVLHQNHSIDPNNLILHQAALRDTALYKFMMAELGYDFCKSSLETLESEVLGFTAVCEKMPREILWDFLKATDSGSRLNDENEPSKQASWLNDNITDPADMKDESENGHT